MERRDKVADTISQTLSEEQSGIGMGLYTMMFFIASAASTTLIGKVLDLGSMIQFNPFQRYEFVTSYSNAFFLLFSILIVVIVLYFSLSRFIRNRVPIKSILKQRKYVK